MNDMGTNRGTGRTTRQMWDAPVGAVFIVGFECEIPYACRLAERIGRTDLSIFTASYLEYGRWQGRELTGLVIDHYVRLTDEQRYGYEGARTMVRK